MPSACNPMRRCGGAAASSRGGQSGRGRRGWLPLPEVARRREFRDDLARPQARGLNIGDRVLGNAPLLIRGVEDCRTVAQADVIPLPVLRGGIVNLEEERQQVAEARLFRLEGDLDRLGVRAVVAVGRVRHVPAGVPDAGAATLWIGTRDIVFSWVVRGGRSGRFIAHPYLFGL